MSSSTSSSDRFRRFTLGVLLLAFLPAALFFAIGIWLQPLDGDLTRAGSFSQRHYGWNSTQIVYRTLRYSLGPYDRPYDVVVYGDSFAVAMPSHQWQNRLAEATGLSVITLNVYTDPLARVLENPVFVATPPKVFVLTLAERHFPEQLAKLSDCAPDATPPQSEMVAAAPANALPAMPTDLPTIADAVETRRQTHWQDLREVKIGYAAKTVFHTLLRAVSKRERTKVVRVSLTRDDLFSNLDPGRTLVYRDDVDKVAQWQAEGLDGLVCRIETLRRRIEANGVTRFVLLVAPDKLTAYEPYLATDDYRGLSRLAELAERLPGTMPRVDTAIAAVIAAGHVDVYLPNNTHWGSAGHLATGEAVARFIEATNVVPR
ncbi:MAG TPA: hypothetical protein VIS73_05535 [Rhodocyclaceae bacterium]